MDMILESQLMMQIGGWCSEWAEICLG